MSERDITEFIRLLEQAGWTVVTNPEFEFDLNTEVLARYPNIPASYLLFLENVARCVHPEQQRWFFCAEDYNRTSDSSFHPWWLEEFLIEGAATDDEALEIKELWDRQFPIMFAVHSDYSYLALDLSPKYYGSVLHADVFADEPERVLGSFDELILTLSAILREELDREKVPLSISPIFEFI